MKSKINLPSKKMNRSMQGSDVTGRGAGGSRVPPDTSDREVSTDLPGKREARENEEEKK